MLVSVLASVDDDVQSSTRPEVTCDLSDLMSLCGGEVQPGLRGRDSSVSRVESTVSDVRSSELEVTVRIRGGAWSTLRVLRQCDVGTLRTLFSELEPKVKPYEARYRYAYTISLNMFV